MFWVKNIFVIFVMFNVPVNQLGRCTISKIMNESNVYCCLFI